MASFFREIGRVSDADGREIVLGTDCDAVVMRLASGAKLRVLRLGPDEREQFQKLFMEAERQAEAWQREHTTGTQEASDPQ